VSSASALRSSDIMALHDAALGAAAPPAAGASPIEENHWHNCKLWEQEDLARRRHAADAEIAANKRAIDRHNQSRNDAVERIDEALLAALREVPRKSAARLSSETAGAMIDRLSILALKIHHMRLQTERRDVGRDHIEACNAKLARLVEQRADLAGCLDRLLMEAWRGESYFKAYRQFKMYNDPQLNPAIYGEKG
jgi:imidazolonepropionase-like amidohydrolase